jgi:hypothetical protein
VIVKPDFLSHWKTELLCGLLGDKGAPLFLIHLWSHCEKQHAWRFADMPAVRLKAICRASVPADVFEKALVDAGFVARDGDVLVVLKWDEYNAGLIASWTNGSLGGRPPKRGKLKPADNPPETHGLPTDNPTATVGEPIKILTLIEDKTLNPTPPNPLVAEGEPEVRRRSRRDSQMTSEMAERFERFYGAYPRKAGRAAAEKAFAKLSPDDEQIGAILAALAVAKASREWLKEWLKDDGEFIPHPSSWLNGKRWTDEVQAQATAYTEAELAVIDAYAAAMPDDWPPVDRAFVPSRAAAIRDFLSLALDKPDMPERYFAHCAAHLAVEPRCGFDWLVRRETLVKVREGVVRLKECVQ